MAPNCGVCVDNESKYKCPTCLTPYCSLPCYKTHKETPCKKEPEQATVSQDEQASEQSRRSFEVGEDDSGWRLHQSQLETLAVSDEIRRTLRDAELRKLIQQVDSSIIPEKDLDKAMEDPAFRQFTDKILATITCHETSQTAEL